MKRMILLSVLSLGSLAILSLPNAASAGAGFVFRAIDCPRTGFTLIPPGSRLELSDFVVSADAPTEVKLRFSPFDQQILRLFLNANETVVVNLTGQVESDAEQALKVDCTGTANLGVTAVGTTAF